MKTATREHGATRHPTVRVLSLLGVLLVTFLGVGMAPATAGTPTAGLAGVWDATVHITLGDQQMTNRTIFTFNADNTLDAVSPEGPGGEPYFEGTGYWHEVRPAVFAFYIDHPADPVSNTGAVQAVHIGTIYRNTFYTTARSFLDFGDGSPVIGPITVRAEGTRVG